MRAIKERKEIKIDGDIDKEENSCGRKIDRGRGVDRKSTRDRQREKKREMRASNRKGSIDPDKNKKGWNDLKRSSR